MDGDLVVADILREQIEEWDRLRVQRAIEVAVEQVKWWQGHGFSPDVCLLLLTGSARRPRTRRAALWQDVFEAAVFAYGEIQKGRLVSFSLLTQ